MTTTPPNPGPHVCPHRECKKQFARKCDLNKHMKSHDRPCKCPHVACKFHKRGFPSSNELGRHINDVHSHAPKTYACEDQSCSFKSKRPSNLKQHMENKHGHSYPRSRGPRNRQGASQPSRHDEQAPVTVDAVLRPPASILGPGYYDSPYGDAMSIDTSSPPNMAWDNLPDGASLDDDFLSFTDEHGHVEYGYTSGFELGGAFDGF